MSDSTKANGEAAVGTRRTLVDQIRHLLSEAEAITAEPQERPLLPKVVVQIVEDLHPLLPPLESTLFWYLFVHAEVVDGMRVARGSRRQMQAAVAATPYRKRGGKVLAYFTIQEHLQALEAIGAIKRLHGRSNRGGTLYEVFLPDEIQACWEFRALRSASAASRQGNGQDDYYNNPENRLKIYERDQMSCRYCRRNLTPETVTLDHLVPVSKGGGHEYENIVTACCPCNSSKNNRSAAEFVKEVASS